MKVPATALLTIVMASGLAWAQAPANAKAVATQPNAITPMHRAEALDMLNEVRHAIEHDYYDPTFHGVDLEAQYNLYKERIRTVPTLGAAFRNIAAFAGSLHDSHTFFVPPQRNWSFFYGFRWRLIGDRCFITDVRPDTSAAALVKPGDEIVRLEGYSVNRKDINDLTYDLFQLEPRGGLRLDLRAPDGTLRKALVRTKFVNDGLRSFGEDPFGEEEYEQLERLSRPRYAEMGDILIWNLPSFEESDHQLDDVLQHAKKASAVVLDLRGNPGGAVDALRFLLGGFFPDKVTVGTLVGRKKQDPIESKKQSHPFTGKLAVLIDSQSASAAELFARVIQLNHRGQVVGEPSMGAVMESQFQLMHIGADISIYYGASITREDILMADGHSLENVGVTPDVLVAPSAADLAAGLDPALAKAVSLVGGKLDPATAGRFFPFIWRPYSLTH